MASQNVINECSRLRHGDQLLNSFGHDPSLHAAQACICRASFANTGSLSITYPINYQLIHVQSAAMAAHSRRMSESLTAARSESLQVVCTAPNGDSEVWVKKWNTVYARGRYAFPPGRTSLTSDYV